MTAPRHEAVAMMCLPDPTRPWDRRASLALDAAIVAYETFMGLPVGSLPDPYELLALLQAMAMERVR